MVVDGRRDHSFRVPRPDLSEQLETPNACNKCHTRPMETAAWAASAVREWYGDKRPDDPHDDDPHDDDPHYGVAFVAARRGEPEGLDLLKQLLRRRETPEIVRATAVDLLGNYPAHDTKSLSRDAVEDADALVRVAGLRSLSLEFLRSFPQKVASYLHDEIRLVRLAAARRLVGDAARLIGAKYRSALEEAIVEYRNAQKVMEERAAAHLNLAGLSQGLGNNRATIESLRKAMMLEPYLSGMRDRLAQLLEQSGGDPVEIRQLRTEETELLKRNYKFLPENVQLYAISAACCSIC